MKKLIFLSAIIFLCAVGNAEAQKVDKKAMKAEAARLDSIKGANARNAINEHLWQLNANTMTLIKETATSSINPVLSQNMNPDLTTTVSSFIMAGTNGLMVTDFFNRDPKEYYYFKEGAFQGTIQNDVFKQDKKGKITLKFELKLTKENGLEAGAVIPCTLTVEPNSNEAKIVFEFTQYEYQLQFKGTVTNYVPAN